MGVPCKCPPTGWLEMTKVHSLPGGGGLKALAILSWRLCGESFLASSNFCSMAYCCIVLHMFPLSHSCCCCWHAHVCVCGMLQSFLFSFKGTVEFGSYFDPVWPYDYLITSANSMLSDPFSPRATFIGIWGPLFEHTILGNILWPTIMPLQFSLEPGALFMLGSVPPLSYSPSWVPSNFNTCVYPLGP